MSKNHNAHTKRIITSSIVFVLLGFLTGSSLAEDIKITKKDIENNKYFIFGEDHGTIEDPDLFYDILNFFIKNNYKVCVGLEIPNSEKFVNYVKSKTTIDDKKEFLEESFWTREDQDGRSSKEIFKLLTKIISLYKAGKVQKIIPFQSDIILSNADYEKHMAQNILSATKTCSSKVLILTGSIHARKTKWGSGENGYKTMAAYFPQQSTKTFIILNDGGTSWECMGQKEGKSICGVVEFPEYDKSGNIRIDPSTGAYDYTIDLGEMVKYSPPMIINKMEGPKTP